jgi:class 3 adenylate cyclase/tetratricopeptide (TPR) repeat protein
MPMCATCGQENPAGFRFCGHCGAALVDAPASPREERKVLTVVYADLVGSTARSERLDPEEVRAVLAPYHARLRTELERFGGTVEKFIGDAVVALFGAPVVHEDDPERAVRAALAIQDAIVELNEEKPGLELEVRVGVTTGEALVALDARPEAGEGMAAGDVMNTGARLQAAAPPGGVLVGETTYRATRHVIDYEPVAPVEGKGKSAPILAWRALQPRSRLGVDVRQHGAAPLVGRTRERDLLRTALERCRSEHETQLITLVGVPGIGKSRLVWELLQIVEADPEIIYWRQGRCLPYGDGVSFWAVGEMVKAHAGILDTDDAAATEEKLRATLGDILGAEAPRVERYVRPLVGLPVEGASSDRATEAHAAWRRLFEGIAEQRPLVLVFEDLHWADDGLLDFVDHIADWARGVPLLLLCTARPELLERRPHWGGGKLNASTLALAPLTEAETEELVVALGREHVDDAARAVVLARAAGNPLYAEQFVRMVSDRGDDAATLPETVQGIVAARLDALPPPEKELLHRAAVIGKVFWSGAVAAVDGGDRYDIELLLHALERKEIVRRERRSSVGGETEYAFRHALLRDVAYGQIPRAARADLHRGAAEWIEGLGRIEDLAELRAHHWLNAAEYAKRAGTEAGQLERRARTALLEAADRARALNALTTADRFYGQALELWPPDDPERDFVAARRVAVGLLLGLPLDRPAAVELAERLVDRGRPADSAVVEIALAHDALNVGDRKAATVNVARSRSLVEDLPPSREKILVLGFTARLLIGATQFEDAIEIGRQLLEVAGAFGDTEGVLAALTTIGTCTALLGGDTAQLETAIERAEAAGSPEFTRGLKNLASILVERGDLDHGVEAQERSLEESERLGSPWDVAWSQGELAWCCYLQGRWDDALGYADTVLRGVETGTAHYIEPVARIVRAQIRIGRDDVAGALEDSELAADLGLRQGDQLMSPTLATHAAVLADAGRLDDARAVADELLARSPDEDLLWSSGAWVALDQIGYSDRMLRAGRPPGPSPWYDAGSAYARGAFLDAADTLAAIGARTAEAAARQRAGETLLEQGRSAEAGAQLSRALAFWRSVGATRYVRDAEALLQTA